MENNTLKLKPRHRLKSLTPSHFSKPTATDDASAEELMRARDTQMI